ncbi:MAG TPA: ferritin-like domain-containing protein [Flavisolibacter sp.]|jgi:ferritin-like metal-binding protein YciE
MDNMNHLRDLLMFDIQHLYSAEVQIMEALPAMIAKASNPELKRALEQHLNVTEIQRQRLDQVKQMMGVTEDNNSGGAMGIFAGLFNPGTKSKGIDGLITDGEKIMAIDMAPAVMDAAIIGCSQKIEHFEIAAYGTARTYAEQLGLIDVAQLLQQTLIEEHDADDMLTALAVGKVNQQAEAGVGNMAGTMSNTPSNANM